MTHACRAPRSRSRICAIPRLRGRGVVAHLLAAAEAHLRALGVRRIRIGVLAANASALRAYAKHGFEAYEVVMEKRVCS